MNIVPIKTLSDVILFHMQKEERKTAEFFELWAWCEKSHLRHADPAKHKSAFVSGMCRAVEELEGSELIEVTRGAIAGSYRPILSIKLTPKGIEYVKPTHTCFSNQVKA